MSVRKTCGAVKVPSRVLKTWYRLNGSLISTGRGGHNGGVGDTEITAAIRALPLKLKSSTASPRPKPLPPKRSGKYYTKSSPRTAQPPRFWLLWTKMIIKASTKIWSLFGNNFYTCSKHPRDKPQRSRLRYRHTYYINAYQVLIDGKGRI